MKQIQNKQDIQKGIEILSNAYFNAENISWIFPKKDKSKMKRFFSVLLHDAILRNGAFISKDETGVLLLYRQNSKSFSIKNLFRKLVVLFFVTGLTRGLKAIKHQRNVTNRRPKEGWLGMGLAIDGCTNLTELVYEFKKEALQMVDDSGLPAYAETTVPRVKKLYEHLGFQVYDSMPHPYADLTVWFLKRDASNQKAVK